MRWLSALLGLAGVHAVLALACAGALLLVDAPGVLGEHPATKPLKFALSLSLLLVSIALILRRIEVADGVRATLAWVLATTLVVEMVAIVAQAARGRSSHFNTSTPLDGAIWHLMGGAIVLAMLAIVAICVTATVRPLRADPLLATAIRIGLWLLLLVAISGFAMGGRGQHGVGGLDGGAGMPVTGWSTTHGDLRVPHFFALHGVQALPVIALILLALPMPGRARWICFAACALVWTGVAVGTLVQALRGRPLVSRVTDDAPPASLVARPMTPATIAQPPRR